MQFLNRQSELGLNILQLMHSNPKREVWSSGVIAEQLKDSELFVHQVMQMLRQTGYVFSIKGPSGGYKMHPAVPDSDLKTFMQNFNREYRPSSILSTDHASELANQMLTGFLSSVKLRTLFEGKKPTPALRFKLRPGDQGIEGGIA